jgi:hypothetical protein
MYAEYKKRAIELRREDKTYSEIRSEVPVAKSTLSLWLRSVGLADSQSQRITEKRIEAQRRGAQARRNVRVAEVMTFVNQGISDVGELSDRELWLIGVSLYWGEGSKQRKNLPSTGVEFCNSDARMITAFMHWLDSLSIPKERIVFELYIHETRSSEIPLFQEWWSEQLGIPIHQLNRVYLKRGNPKTNRHNVADLYHGLVRIRVRSSTSLNRQISGWIAGIVASLGSGVTGNTSAFEAEDSRIVP